MGLFSGLENFGFRNVDMGLYSEEEEKKKKAEEQAEAHKETELREEDCLFSKTYSCPLCGSEFKTLSVKAGKVRSIGQDEDLRPLYREMDPLKYDAIVCPKCGYGALNRYFESVMSYQAKRLNEGVRPFFKGMSVSEDIYSYDEAITRYKMVLMCDVAGGVKSSRKAYTCVKLAWVIKGKLETEGDKLTEEEKKRLLADEQECIENAYEGYKLAFSNESFPMSGLDEVTVTYLTAVLAFRVGEYKEAKKYLSKLLVNKSVPSRIKDKALTLKDLINEKAEE